MIRSIPKLVKRIKARITGGCYCTDDVSSLADMCHKCKAEYEEWIEARAMEEDDGYSVMDDAYAERTMRNGRCDDQY